jgi:uncharacterized protein (DUF885 family)
MSRKFLSLLYIVLLALSSAVPLSASSINSAGDNKGKFAELSDQFMKDSLAQSPSSASQAGYHKHVDEKTGKTIELDALLDDMSWDFIMKQRAFLVAWRDRFHKETPVDSLDPQDAADWHLIDDQIGLVLLDVDKIQSARHNPLGAVELIGSSIFQPMTTDYAPKHVRVGHMLARIGQIPRFLKQVRETLIDADPVFIQGAIDANDGNIDLIENMVPKEIPPVSTGSINSPGSTSSTGLAISTGANSAINATSSTDSTNATDVKLRAEYDRVAPLAIAALKDFSRWLQDDLAKHPASRSWRLGQPLYDEKFKLVIESNLTPREVLADAEQELQAVRAEMLQLAEPMHKQMYPDHGDHSDLSGREREKLIITEVLQQVSADHPERDALQTAIEADLESIKQFIREKKIVSLSERENLKVVPTPPFMRASYSVAGFHGAPPLDPQAEAQYWVTPIDKSNSAKKAESKLREYNNFALKWLTIHEALPGHYIQFEHLNNIQPARRRLLRSIYGNGAYIEGWAEYIAQVMMDEGFLNNDPRFRLVMRKIRLRVLGNAILDIKMQTMNMTDAQAMDLLTKEAFQTEAEAEGKLRRAKLSSTQLPTYYVGLREWLSLRKKYEKAQGQNFDMLKFHNLVLDQGPLPVPIIEKLVLP